MRRHRHADAEKITALGEQFKCAVKGVELVFADSPFRRIVEVDSERQFDKTVNRAIFDIQMITFGMISPEWLRANRSQVRRAFETLCLEDVRFADSVSRATANKRQFGYRLHTWAASLEALGAELSERGAIPEAPAD